MNNLCPHTEQCPLFNGILKDKNMTIKAYKKQYCEAGFENYSTCKRYISSETFGKCPDDLLPNSTLTMEQIKERYHYM